MTRVRIGEADELLIEQIEALAEEVKTGATVGLIAIAFDPEGSFALITTGEYADESFVAIGALETAKKMIMEDQ